jgi:hypothetical protein
VTAPTVETVIHWTVGPIYALCGATEGWRSGQARAVSCPACHLELVMRREGRDRLRVRVIRPARRPAKVATP